MRTATLVIALVTAAAAAADDAATAAAHAAVREALLEHATLPVEQGPPRVRPSPRSAHENAARARQEEAERAAHSRAAAHGARHSRDARPGHDGGTSPRGSTHDGSTMGGSGMHSGWDCQDPAAHERTRGMHEGEMQPDGGGRHGH